MVRIVGNDLRREHHADGQVVRHSDQGLQERDARHHHGVYETDVFEGTVNPGDDLKVSANGKLTAGVQAGEEVIARAVSVSGGTIKFRLLI